MNMKKTLLTLLLAATSSFTYSQQITKSTIKPLPPLEVTVSESTTQQTIMYDAGHSDQRVGKHRGNLKEEEIVLYIALEAKKLHEDHMNVILTRTTGEALHKGYSEDLQARVKMRTKYNPDYFVSIHVNSFNKSSIKGMEIYYFGVSSKKYINNGKADFFNPEDTKRYESTPSKELAFLLQQYVFEKTGELPRVMGRDLTILKRNLNDKEELNEKNIYIELGYITNPEDRKKIEENPQQYAKLIAGFFNELTSK